MRVPTLITNRTRPSATPLAAPSGAGATPEAFGAQIGRSAMQFGAGLQALGAYVQQQQEKQNRFDSLRRLSAFSTRVEQTITEAKRTAGANPSGFAETIAGMYQEMERRFLDEEIPADLREEFSVRTGELGANVASDALRFQFEQTDQYFRNGIDDAFQQARVELGQNGTLEDLDLQRARLDEIIQASGLSDAEKIAIQRKAYAGMEAIVYRNEQVKLLMAEAQGSAEGPARSQALSLMSIISGSSPDELGQRVEIGEQLAVQSLGSIDAWAELPSRVRASLIAVAADYGGLPQDVVAAVRSGNLDAIAGTIRELPTPGADSMADLVNTPTATIDDDPRFANIPYEDRVALTEDAQRQVAATLTEMDKAAQAQNAALVNALHTALFDGTAGQMEIDAAREEGWLTDIQDIEKAHNLLEERDRELRLTQYAQDRIASGVPFNPNSEDDRDALNALLGKQGQAALQQMDSNYVAASLIPMVRRAQDIPTEAIGTLIGMMRSQNGRQQAWALDTLSQLQQASPRAYDHRMTDADADTVEFWRQRKNFYPEDQLLGMVRGGLTVEERRQTEELRKQARTILSGKEGEGLTKEVLNAFGATPVAGVGVPTMPWTAQTLLSEFRVRFEDEYARYGTVDEAKAAAIRGLQRDWSITDIGGRPTLMKWAPERAGYRPLNGSFQWIEDQVLAELNAYIPNRGLFEQLTGISRAQAIASEAQGRRAIQGFQLISDEQTRAEVEANKRGGPAPSYMIAVTDENGVTRLLQQEIGEKGRERIVPQRIFFEVTPEMEAQQVEEFMRERERVLAEEQARTFLGAQRFSLETGIPIPEDIGTVEPTDVLGGWASAVP